jgi:hypothetical protein
MGRTLFKDLTAAWAFFQWAFFQAPGTFELWKFGAALISRRLALSLPPGRLLAHKQLNSLRIYGSFFKNVAHLSVWA